MDKNAQLAARAITTRNRRGLRKYLNESERKAFLKAAQALKIEHRLLCEVYYYTGCRASEALNLTVDDLDFGESVLLIETLKQRGAGGFRDVPVPLSLLKELAAIARDGRIFTVSRSTAWRLVKGVMKDAGIAGEHATIKGLRHGFALSHVAARTSESVIQQWLGHASIETVRHYMKLRGKEAIKVAKRVW